MVNFASTIAGESRSNLRSIVFPANLSLDFEGESRLMAVGIGSIKVIRADILSASLLVASNVGEPGFVAILTSDALLFTRLVSEPREAVELTAVLTSEGVLVGSALRLQLRDIVLASDGEMLADMQPFLPEPREPEWFELRGTVNLLRNASVEQTDVGLRDWGGVVGATLALDDTFAWHGSNSVQVTFPSSGANAGVTVKTQGGLGLTGGTGTLMVGSLSLSGTITQIKTRLTATYRDATTDSIDGDLFDLATAADDWLRASTPSLALNPAKVLDVLTLAVLHPTAGSVTVIHADGAQIEQDRGEGATPFAQGDMGEHYAWLGPEGLSMSLRETMAVTT